MRLGQPAHTLCTKSYQRLNLRRIIALGGKISDFLYPHTCGLFLLTFDLRFGLRDIHFSGHNLFC